MKFVITNRPDRIGLSLDLWRVVFADGRCCLIAALSVEEIHEITDYKNSIMMCNRVVPTEVIKMGLRKTNKDKILKFVTGPVVVTFRSRGDHWLSTGTYDRMIMDKEVREYMERK